MPPAPPRKRGSEGSGSSARRTRQLEPERAELLRREDQPTRRADLRDLLDRDRVTGASGARSTVVLPEEEPKMPCSRYTSTTSHGNSCDSSISARAARSARARACGRARGSPAARWSAAPRARRILGRSPWHIPSMLFPSGRGRTRRSSPRRTERGCRAPLSLPPAASAASWNRQRCRDRDMRRPRACRRPGRGGRRRSPARCVGEVRDRAVRLEDDAVPERSEERFVEPLRRSSRPRSATCSTVSLLPSLQSPRMILENGVIRTMDPTLPTTRALAIAGRTWRAASGRTSWRPGLMSSISAAAASFPASPTRTSTSRPGRSRSAR